MSVILETKQLCKFYGAGENQVKAVNQVDIQIEQTWRWKQRNAFRRKT